MHEIALRYGEGVTPLAGVLTMPEQLATEPPAFLILGAGIVHRVGPNRLHPSLARALADAGFVSFRFDFAGFGDCPPRRDALSLADGVASDVEETLDMLERRLGVGRFVVAGLCSGADNALRAAARDERVVAAVMLDPTVWRTRRWYLEHYGRRAVQPRIWRDVLTGRHPIWSELGERVGSRRGEEAAADAGEVAPPELFRTGYLERETMARDLSKVLARGTRLFTTFTGSWSPLYNYAGQLFDVFPQIDFGDRLRLAYRPETDHTFSDPMQRQRLLTEIVEWTRASDFAPGRSPRPPLRSAQASSGS